MIKEDEKQRFLAWVERKKIFSKASAQDVVCRLGRVDKLTPLHTVESAEDFLFQLGKKSEFSKLGPSVKSQLKRAYKLYHQFKTGQKH